MNFRPSTYSFSGYGNTEPKEVIDSAKESAKEVVDKAERKRKRIAKRRKKALQKAKRQAIVIPVAVGGSLLLLGLIGFGVRAMMKKKTSKAKGAK
jgi:hypothetical protein